MTAPRKSPKTSPADTWPANKIEMWPIDDLVPYARNARKHGEEQVRQIAASIAEFGFTIPVLVAEDGTIIAGHGRTLAAQSLGIGEVPVIVARGWSEEQRRAYTLADNKLAENATWDDDLLRLELGELQELGVDGLDLGFGADELKSILDGWTTDIDLAERDGEHTDGITRTIKATVAQDDVGRAKEAITAALRDAGIEAEIA